MAVKRSNLHDISQNRRGVRKPKSAQNRKRAELQAWSVGIAAAIRSAHEHRAPSRRALDGQRSGSPTAGADVADVREPARVDAAGPVLAERRGARGRAQAGEALHALLAYAAREADEPPPAAGDLAGVASLRQ